MLVTVTGRPGTEKSDEAGMERSTKGGRGRQRTSEACRAWSRGTESETGVLAYETGMSAGSMCMDMQCTCTWMAMVRDGTGMATWHGRRNKDKDHQRLQQSSRLTMPLFCVTGNKVHLPPPPPDPETPAEARVWWGSKKGTARIDERGTTNRVL